MPDPNKLDDTYGRVDNAEHISKNQFSMFEEVPIYSDLLDKNRKNYSLEGFSFTVDAFENLVDWFVPKDNIPIILSVSKKELDDFCKLCYGMSYSETYAKLHSITDAEMRNVFKNLAKSGNNTASNIVAKHFMELKDEEEKKAVSVTFVNDLPKDGEK